MSIKGSWRRPRSVTREEETLRDDYMNGRIGYATYKRRYAKLMKAGLIRRSGRIIRSRVEIYAVS